MTADVENLSNEARQALRQKEYEAAINGFQQVLEVEQGNVAAHEGVATAAFLSGDYDLAIHHFERVTRLEPRQSRALVNLGAIYNRIGRHQQAVTTLRRAIQKDSRCAEAFYNLGIAHRKLDQPSMAVSAYREAIRLDPQMAAAYQNLGNVYSDMKNYRQAVANYQTALEIQPDFERAQVGLHRAQEAIEQAKLAISPFGRLVDESNRYKSPLTASRHLSDEERQEDRDAVRQLAAEIEHLARDCLIQLRDQVEPAFVTLNRVVVQSNEAPFAMSKAHRDFLEAVQAWKSLRKQLKRKVLELRAHEELIHSPRANLHPVAPAASESSGESAPES